MRKDASWVGTAALTPDVLRHEQGHFDIWELFGRRLRHVLRDSTCADLTNGRLQARIDEVLARLQEAHIDYDALTQHGTLLSAQRTETERIEQELAATAGQ
jgi:predicted secreted Zn-dependent protease